MKKKISIVSILLLVLLVIYWAWGTFFAPTKIGMVNYPEFLYSKMAGAPANKFIKFENIEQTNLPKLKKYDMVFFFGMGLKLTADQEAIAKEMGEKGVPMFLQSSTTKGLDLTYLPEEHKEEIEGYLNNGGNKNYKNLFNYVRLNIDGKKTFTEVPDSVMEIASEVLFYKDEDVAFEKVEEFEAYCKTENIHKEGNKKVIFFTSVPGPFNANREHLNSLITELEERNFNVYPVSAFAGRLGYMKAINPDLIVYMPHGRLSLGGGSASAITKYLKEQNVPVLCPVTVHQQYDEWKDDKQGMMGGLLSQSVTMPEFDGGIAPYALFAEYTNEQGLVVFKAIPNRLKKFGEIAKKYARLADIDNSEKKVAIVYFKGPGKNAMVAANMEVLPSLHNVLLRLKKEGYNLGDLPTDFDVFEKRIMTEGPVLGPYAEGAFDNYLKNGNPELVNVDDYNQWCQETLPREIITDVENRYGKAPGSYMAVYKNEQDYIAVARVQFGNVVVLPQQLPGLGNNTFALVHGAKVAPPHTYIAPYLWIQKDFNADAIFHFGTHGSLEFTPGKQIALSDYDWTDPLIGTTPHNYIYTISNIGEGMIAKRRSYAATQTYLTPPFIKADAAQAQHLLVQKMDTWASAVGAVKKEHALSAKAMIVKENIHSELQLDDNLEVPYTNEEMKKITNFLAELENEKVTGGLYTLNVPYSQAHLDETILMIHNDELGFALSEIDILNQKVSRKKLNDPAYFRAKYVKPATKYVRQVINSGNVDGVINKLIDKADYQRAMAFKQERAEAKRDLGMRMMAYAKMQKEAAMKKEAEGGEKKTESTKKKNGGHPSWIPKKKDANSSHKKSDNSGKEKDSHPQGEMAGHSVGKKADGKKPEVDAESGATPKIKPADPVEEVFANAVFAVENTLNSIVNKKVELKNSPEYEMKAILNALNGGYTEPGPGGDPIANPESVPTGRNLFSINAENTPTKEAWQVAKRLTKDLLEDYKTKHNGVYPKKISFTLWAGSFIESEGTTIAQILYMLGVEPIWTPRGKVNDIRLMTEEELGRPRIDVVVQTSGQLRDLAASRLFVINRAIKMAADANEENNQVASGRLDAEKFLIDKGFSPKEAREMASHRVFGGVNGNYGAAIMGMVEKSDSWDSTQSVAQTYINNMGAVYGSEDNWGDFSAGIFEAALLNTEAVVQPRQSNTWGALSLDHVYEFMGGLNLAITEVTGNDAESYFNDFRNSSNPKVQSLKEAIGVESRTTLLNPRYINEMMKGSASSAEHFAETFRNTFGWNVMKPTAIDDKLWDDLYNVYVEDKLELNVHTFFKTENPYALQEISAIMLETARKGMWKASPEQIKAMSELHAKLVKDHDAGCSGFVCDNAKLRAFINKNLPQELKQQYAQEISNVLEAPKDATEENVVLKKEQEKVQPKNNSGSKLSTNKKVLIGAGVLLLILVAVFVRKRRK